MRMYLCFLCLLVALFALWEAAAETKVTELGKAGDALSLASNAELPSGVVSNGKLFVAYIAKEKEKRSVWLKRV